MVAWPAQYFDDTSNLTIQAVTASADVIEPRITYGDPFVISIELI